MSRWADPRYEADLEAQRTKEKEAKRKARAEKQRQLQEAQRRQQQATSQLQHGAESQKGSATTGIQTSKRRKLAGTEADTPPKATAPAKLLRFIAPGWGPCRHVDAFEKLNHIEEGSYGWVSRAKEIATGEVVALKKLKMDNANDGFPVTGLREIQTLMESRHPGVVKLREVVVGDSLDDVFLVMDFLEHDLKTLQEDMQEPFLPSEIKALLVQLVSATDYLHSNWIVHRDLKTSNLLMNNRGQVKVADFGMARYFGDPPPKMTQLVVTLWYRAPELLLGADDYGKEVDVWSIGCIFGELLTKEPLLQGKNEVDQLSKIFELVGMPTEATWPGFKRLPNAKSLRLPRSTPPNSGAVLRAKFPFLTSSGSQLLSSLLALNPATRPSTGQILAHPYFKEDPRPKSSAMFPTFPSKAGLEKRRRGAASPAAPRRGAAPGLGGKVDFSSLAGGIFTGREEEEVGAGFALRLV